MSALAVREPDKARFVLRSQLASSRTMFVLRRKDVNTPADEKTTHLAELRIRQTDMRLRKETPEKPQHAL